MPVDAGGLLLVHAHPDDEVAGTGGVIARTVAEGRRVDLVTCTGGEEGEIHDPELDADEARPRLRDIRLAELACSVSALGKGALKLHLLGYRDSGMMDTESNTHPECFWQADVDDATRRLVEIVRAARPSVIVGYDSNGGYGHPDHIQAHRIAVAAFEAAADASRYPDAGPPHQVEKLYELAFNREEWFWLMKELRTRGISLPWGMDEQFSPEDTASDLPADELNPTNIEALREVSEDLNSGEAPSDFGTPEAEISTRVNVSAHLEAKRDSMACHRTQQQDLGWMLALPEDLIERAMGTEYFVLRTWSGRDSVPADLRETSLFDGL